jgi:hypothetical protein
MPELLVRVALAIARGFFMPASAKASIRTSAPGKYSGIADLGLTEFAKRRMPGAPLTQRRGSYDTRFVERRRGSGGGRA